MPKAILLLLLLLIGLAVLGLAAGDTVRGASSKTSNEQHQQSTRSLQVPIVIADFVPLACNANLAAALCTSWSTKFGTASTLSNRVVVACGECIRMDHPGPILTLSGGIDIHGKLLFPDSNTYKIEVRTPLIAVQGELEMISSSKAVDGTPLVKFLMTGDADQTYTPVGENALACGGGGTCNAGKKAVVVAGGKMNIRGLPANTPSWLRLFDVSSDLKTIVVNATARGKWAPGAEILITSHMRKWDGHQVRKITQVTPLENDARYVSLALNATIDRPTTLKDSADYAVEVALLSRNILFQGDVDAKPAHGGHFWVFHTPKVKQYIEGVDFQNFGQQGTLGRYPIHFHMCHDVAGSIVAKNTIRLSNQRCIVVHGTDKLRIEENVAYNTKGHCFMLEDGIETGNQFIRNLGAHTSIPATIIPNMGSNGLETDNEPSTFWMTNPSNIWIGNVAAGSERAGFWFELKVRGTRAAQFGTADPKRTALTLFQDNIAHSNAVHGMRTYPTGYTPDQEATLLGAKCYRNTFGMFVHASRNVVVKGGLFADNMIGVDIDRDDNTRLVDSKVVGESVSYRNLMVAKQQSDKVCNSPHVGVELHTQLLTAKNKAIAIDNVEFSFFSHIRCNDAVPFSLDSSTQTGLFDSFTTVRKATFADNDGDNIDFCPAKTANILDIYIIDLDGSLRPVPSSTTTGTSTLVVDQPNMLKFVDPSKCQLVTARCHSYCRNTCFRTIRFVVEPAGSYRMKVCRKGSRDTCSITTGATNHEDPLFAKRRREFIAHLPLGSYDTVFIDSNGADTWPAFVNIDADDALCPESFTDSDVKVMVPTLRTATAVQQSECASLIKNGNFQGSNTDPIFWLHNYGGIKLAPGKGIAGSNGAVGIEKSYLTTFLQFIDNRCIQVNVNQWYELKASIKLTNNDGSIFVCDAVKQTCPDIGLHTDIDGFTRVTYVSMQSLGNGFYSAQGFVQINARLAETSKDGMSLYVRSGVEGKLLTVDDVSTRLQVHTNYCKNLIRFGTMDDTSWKGLWVPNGPNLPAVISSISPGYNNSPTAMRTSKRSSSAEGPTYIGFRNIDMACMTPGSVWRIAVQVKLLDRATGKGASCNVNQRDDCPSFRISIRNGSGDRFFAEQYRTYAAGAANWNPDAFQKLQADFTLPPSATWDGRIKTIEFAIRDFPVDYDLIVDDVSLSPVV